MPTATLQHELNVTISLALFDTAIGRCAIAWGDAGIVAVQLPEGHDIATLRRLQRQFPGACEEAAPQDVRDAMRAMTDLLDGAAVDLSSVQLDMRQIPALHRHVYEVTRMIAPGATLHYGAVAEAVAARLPAGSVAPTARDVGQILGRNPFSIVVPCHRVITASGKPGGFSAGGGTATKIRMLAIESPHALNGLALFSGAPAS